MRGTGTRLHSPLILQLVQNREAQWVADAQENLGDHDPDPPFFTRQQTDDANLEQMIEWVAVFFQVFWLAVFSGSFLITFLFALKMAGY